MFYKKTISKYLQTNYSDQNLAKLLTACENVKVNFSRPNSCLLGRADGGYQLNTVTDREVEWRILPPVLGPVELAYAHFQCQSGFISYGIVAANKNLAKLVKKEQKRRDKFQQEYEAEGQRLTAELLKPSTLNLDVKTQPVKTKADNLEETTA